jgi:hypothetical protein
VRRLIAAGAAGLMALAVLAGCSSDSDGAVKAGDGTTTTTAEKNGNSSLRLGGNTLPADFPKAAVPLPKDGTLQNAIDHSKGKDASYTLNYGVASGDVAGAAKRYKRALAEDGYRIEASDSAGAAAAVFSAFTAVGKRWDVIVYSSDGTDLATGAATSGIALQATTHDPVKNPDPGATAG